VTPIIIGFDCVDYDPINLWLFPNPKRVDFWMNFTIGPDKRGGDNFQLHVLTTEMVMPETSTANAIVLERYSWDALIQQVNKILEQCQGETWDIISSKLAKYMEWEFDNYQPYKA